ncbi:hypothetical protein Dimus_002463 [Dionaea muscipula]
MVLIELENEEETSVLKDGEKLPTDRPGVSAYRRSDKDDKEVEEEEPTTADKEVLEGFETASEGDGDDRDGEIAKQLEDGGSKERTVPPRDEAYEDALNDDQLKQRALEQANEAKAEGNVLFKDGQYEDALLKYEVGLQLAPEMPSSVELRSICHANRSMCYLKLGKYEETVKECTKALELNQAYTKVLFRRAEAYEKLERFDDAINDMKKILDLDPSNDHARRSIARLEPLAREKMEKMKEEMIGKLKEMGNSILGRFGMSVDNFKTVKDPNTGSYSVSFQR